jgi:cell division protein FtsN
MMILLAIISFITSYYIFYLLTSKVATKDIQRPKEVIVKASEEPYESAKTTIIGEGQGSPSPDTTITPEPSAGNLLANASPSPLTAATATPVATVSPVPTAAPTATAKPVIQATPVPTPVKTTAPVVEPPKPKLTTFKVRVGAFDSKTEADKKAKELENMGYDVTVLDEPEGSYVQLGSFKEQEKALSLAEEISQKGYSVIIRQLEE